MQIVETEVNRLKEKTWLFYFYNVLVSPTSRIQLQTVNTDVKENRAYILARAFSFNTYNTTPACIIGIQLEQLLRSHTEFHPSKLQSTFGYSIHS